MRRARWLLLSLLVVGWVAAAPGVAAGFGTIDGGGQQREHEHLTRAALGCAGVAGAEPDCVEPRTLDYLAGHDREFGAVGAPDNDEVAVVAAHCDDADLLAGAYPRTRDEATAALAACVGQLRTRFAEGVDAAAGLLDAEGRVNARAVSPDPECRPHEDLERRAKCTTLEAFGRVLHGVQDFHSHSNWADEADPSRPLGTDNPPGLGLPGPAPVLDLRGTPAPVAPAGLSTGCYVLRDEVPGVGACAGRVTHAALNKDRGTIDPATGRAAAPTTARGLVGDNFARAVAAAVAESRRQWRDLRSALTARYGPGDGARMICALTRDDPVRDCGEAGGDRAVVLAAAGGLGVALAGCAVAVLRRRRRSR